MKKRSFEVEDEQILLQILSEHAAKATFEDTCELKERLLTSIVDGIYYLFELCQLCSKVQNCFLPGDECIENSTNPKEETLANNVKIVDEAAKRVQDRVHNTDE